MKKIFTFLFSIACLSSIAQNTATNFICNDCSGTSYNLFSELDAGKVIVICWIMPCGTCVSPAITAYNTVQSFQTSHPNRVHMYLVDDYANSSCSTISNWATANNMPNTIKFSNPAINMADYGSPGMPKVVVVGGASHTVFYNANNSVNQSALQTAITNALNASTSIAEHTAPISELSVFPNPAENFTQIFYSLNVTCNVTAEIYNMVGEKIACVFSGLQTKGHHAANINTSKLNNGIYFLNLTAGKSKNTIMLSVFH